MLGRKRAGWRLERQHRSFGEEGVTEPTPPEGCIWCFPKVASPRALEIPSVGEGHRGFAQTPWEPSTKSACRRRNEEPWLQGGDRLVYNERRQGKEKGGRSRGQWRRVAASTLQGCMGRSEGLGAGHFRCPSAICCVQACHRAPAGRIGVSRHTTGAAVPVRLASLPGLRLPLACTPLRQSLLKPRTGGGTPVAWFGLYTGRQTNKPQHYPALHSSPPISTRST